jgi:hypothetical protein
MKVICEMKLIDHQSLQGFMIEFWAIHLQIHREGAQRHYNFFANLPR